jgi:hypothetical protein
MWLAARGEVCGAYVRADALGDEVCWNSRGPRASPVGSADAMVLSWTADTDYFRALGVTPTGAKRVRASSAGGANTAVATAELTGDGSPGTYVTVYGVTLVKQGNRLGNVQLDALDSQGHVMVTANWTYPFN